MIKKAVCEICKEIEHKYRCPQCRTVYCSLPCYKTHKEESCKKEEPVEENKVTDISDKTETTVPEFTLIDEETEDRVSIAQLEALEITVPEFTLIDEETEDRVSIEQLEALEKSDELKDMLCNPHLRQLMTSLVHSGNPGPQLEKAMQEPIFTEFADTCLSIIDNKTDTS